MTPDYSIVLHLTTKEWDSSCSRVSDLSRDVIAIDVRLLQEHVQTPLILSQGMPGNPAKRKMMVLQKKLKRKLERFTCWWSSRALLFFPRWSPLHKCRHRSGMGAAFSRPCSVGVEPQSGANEHDFWPRLKNVIFTRLYLAVTLQLISEPLEIAKPSPNARLFDAENGQVGL